jgi:hypothetical protein
MAFMRAGYARLDLADLEGRVGQAGKVPSGPWEETN